MNLSSINKSWSRLQKQSEWFVHGSVSVGSHSHISEQLIGVEFLQFLKLNSLNNSLNLVCSSTKLSNDFIGLYNIYI